MVLSLSESKGTVSFFSWPGAAPPQFETMTIFRGVNTRARAAVFLLWVILIIFSQLGLYFADHQSLPRKARFFNTSTSASAASSFQAPSSSASDQVAGNETVYGEDKRIVHTGPNPLHN